MPLPTHIELTQCSTGTKELGLIETLNREVAKQEIDAVWWSNLEGVLRDPKDEPDHHWKWRDIVSTYQNKPYFQSKCVRSRDGRVQAAVVFQVDARSALKQGERAVFVDRLATAPRNRAGLVGTPDFRGGGTGLLLYAIALSYSLGFSGRVNLIPVANEHFYRERDFLRTDAVIGDDVVFEISATEALNLLKQRGLIDDR